GRSQRRVQPWRHPLRGPDGGGAVPGRESDGAAPGVGGRAAATAAVERSHLAGPGNHLPEVPAEGAGPALRRRRGPGRRPTAVSGRRAHSSAAGGPGGAVVGLGPAAAGRPRGAAPRRAGAPGLGRVRGRLLLPCPIAPGPSRRSPGAAGGPTSSRTSP